MLFKKTRQKDFQQKNFKFTVIIIFSLFLTYYIMMSSLVNSITFVSPSIGNVLLFYGLGGSIAFFSISVLSIYLFKSKN